MGVSCLVNACGMLLSKFLMLSILAMLILKSIAKEILLRLGLS